MIKTVILNVILFNSKSLLPAWLGKIALCALPLAAIAAPLAISDAPADTRAITQQAVPAPASDVWITNQVKAGLLADASVEGVDIDVSTRNGVVTLAGVLDTRTQIDTAIRLTESVDGVRQVDTRALKVKPPA